jgi:hypothetical protein
MRPNPTRYRASRIAIWIGAVAALALRYLANQTPTVAAIVLAVAVGIGLFIDLVIRKT